MDIRDDNIIEVDFGAEVEIDYSALDIDALSVEQLRKCLAELNGMLAQLDKNEPKNILSEKHEDWEDEHEDLEDLIDDVKDRLDEMLDE